MVPTDSTVLGKNAFVPNSSVDTELSVADIFEFVKKNNDKFESDSDNPTSFTPKPVDQHLVNWNFCLGKSEEVRSKNPVHISERDFWLGWQDSNLRMQQSKCCVLPLDDTPILNCAKLGYRVIKSGVDNRVRTDDLQGHNLAL